jgi:hypothetical protein
MSLVMYDSIHPDTLPGGAAAYAGYVDGMWQTFPVLQQRFRGAHLLSIAVFASGDADCLDVETGDAAIGDIFGWFKRQQARGTWRPAVYSSAVNMDHVVATMTANGFARGSYRLWSAHYAAGMHVCGPATCRLTGTPCDGTQWTSAAFGRSLDESVLNDNFFAVQPPVPAPKPPPTPAPPPPAPVPPSEEENMIELDTNVPAHPLLIPYGTTSMDLLTTAPEGQEVTVSVTFLGQGATAKQYPLSWGTAAAFASVPVPQGIKKGRLDVVSGAGPMVAVRWNT